MKTIKLYGTTDRLCVDCHLHCNVLGCVEAVEWIDGTFDDGVDAVLSCVRNDDASDLTILTLTDANADKVYYPREQVHSNAGVALTLDGTRIAFTEPIVNGFLKLVVASGGNVKVGGCIVTWISK
jgi:hypothetical protein